MVLFRLAEHVNSGWKIILHIHSWSIFCFHGSQRRKWNLVSK